MRRGTRLRLCPARRLVYTLLKGEGYVPDVRFVIITGLSGAGKSTAMRVLEDIGFFCVDNLPPALIPKFAELCAQTDGRITKAAVVCDIRSGGFFDSLFCALSDLERGGFSYEILFLEATDEVLVRRYKESRRRHPLDGDAGTLEAIALERQKLSVLRGSARHIVDTSHMNLHELRDEIVSLFSEGQRPRMRVHVMSFGFKRGLPLDADLVFDVRFLPNPYYVDSLRPIDGTDPRVRDYVFKWPVTQRFLEILTEFVEFHLPHFENEGRSLLNIAIGCTGGQHRSVAIADYLGEQITNLGYTVRTIHRDAMAATAAYQGASS